MRIIDLFETFDDWRGEWVHFSDVPYLKINPRPGHQDPLGLYFFPANFVPWPYWREKKYKITARLMPSAKVLDLAKMTDEQVRAVAERAGVQDELDALEKQYSITKPHQRVDRLWDALKPALNYSRAKLNKLWRSFGYDAIFDDTNSVHIKEVQLIVLDPRVVKVVKVERQKLSAYDKMIQVQQEVVNVCRKYGEINVTSPRRQKHYGRSTLVADVKVTNPGDSDNYARIELYIDPERPTRLIISLTYSHPRLNYGTGATFNIATGDYDFDGLATLDRDLDVIFAKDLHT